MGNSKVYVGMMGMRVIVVTNRNNWDRKANRLLGLLANRPVLFKGRDAVSMQMQSCEHANVVRMIASENEE